MAHKKSYVWYLSKEEIQNRVNKCFCMTDVLIEFGYSRTSGTMTNVFKQLFKKHDIDITHFKPYLNRKLQPYQISLDEILVKNSSYTNLFRLKRRLLQQGLLEYKCECCGNVGIWNGKELTLQLDHKDGDHSNNELTNLRLLCPNCHSQTKTYGSKNSKVYRAKLNNLN